MKKSIVCYSTPLGLNGYWEPLGEHSPGESTPIYKLNAASKEDVEEYRDTYAPKSKIVYM